MVATSDGGIPKRLELAHELDSKLDPVAESGRGVSRWHWCSWCRSSLRSSSSRAPSAGGCSGGRAAAPIGSAKPPGRDRAHTESGGSSENLEGGACRSRCDRRGRIDRDRADGAEQQESPRTEGGDGPLVWSRWSDSQVPEGLHPDRGWLRQRGRQRYHISEGEQAQLGGGDRCPERGRDRHSNLREGHRRVQARGFDSAGSTTGPWLALRLLALTTGRSQRSTVARLSRTLQPMALVAQCLKALGVERIATL